VQSQRTINFKSFTKIDAESLVCFTRAILFETTCGGYMHEGNTMVVEKYLEAFKVGSDVTIINGPPFLNCSGCDYNDLSCHNIHLLKEQ
jgi:hypothetical protein